MEIVSTGCQLLYNHIALHPFSLPSIANLSPNDMACLTPIEIYLDFPPHPKFQTSYLWRSLLLVMLPTCSLIEKRNFSTGIFQGFYLDFKYPFFPEPFWKLSETAFPDVWNIRIKSDTGVFDKGNMWAKWPRSSKAISKKSKP